HRQFPRLRQHLHADGSRGRRLDDFDEHLHLPGLLQGRRHRPCGRRFNAAAWWLLRNSLSGQLARLAGGCLMTKPLVDALRWLIFAAAVLAMNFPVLSTLVTSLKSDAEISASASLWIERPTLD